MGLRNIVLMSLVVGGLHLYFYTFMKLGKKLKYDLRSSTKNGKQFTLGGQIRDNMFWTLASGVSIWTGYEVLMFWAMANKLCRNARLVCKSSMVYRDIFTYLYLRAFIFIGLTDFCILNSFTNMCIFCVIVTLMSVRSLACLCTLLSM